MNNTFKYLFNLAFDKEISIVVDKNINIPFASPKRRLVVVNSYKPFPLAHEIAHIINNDPGVLYLTCSRSSIEGDANKLAVRLLAEYYFQEIEPEQYDIDRFIECYHIPQYLREYCFKIISYWFTKESIIWIRS